MTHPAHLVVANAICASKGWQVVRAAGEGAFKSTFEVLTEGGQARALKVYRQSGAPERTVREIEALRRCNHESLPKLQSFDIFKIRGTPFFYSTEEFLPGGTLTQKLRAGISTEDSAAIGEHLINALSYVSELQLVHRDIKPDNIMFRQDGCTPVLVDFGLVRDLSKESLTQSWAHRGPGTPVYASPEQLNNEKLHIDWRSDQFSLGIVLSLCTLKIHPFVFPGEGLDKAVDRMAQRERPSPLFIKKTKDLGLSVLSRMVGAWPIDRYRDPSQLLFDWKAQISELAL